MRQKFKCMLIPFIVFTFLLSGCNEPIVGPKGEQGEPGIKGDDGYSVLTGYGDPDVELGINGDSYINLSTYDYFVKCDDAWVMSGNIKGEKGQSGLSAYDIYKEYHPDYNKTQEQWLDDLVNGRLGNVDIHEVTFNSNGGTEVEPQFVLHGEKAKKPINPEKEGCQFIDWVDEYDEHWAFNGFTITENITLNAVWKENYDYSMIKITEVCSKNRFSFLDKYGEDSDWIELYNSSSSPVNLNGCAISNSSDNPLIYKFGDVVVDPDSYIILVASGRKEGIYNDECHLPFTLSQKKGGEIVFSAPYGIVDKVEYPALKDDISFGLIGDEYATLIPSPGCSNELKYIEKQILSAPTFSKPSGLYDEEFDLTLSSENGYHIYYTIDSGTPSDSSLPYSSPIHIYDKSSEANVVSARNDIYGSSSPYVPTSPVRKCMVVRAICYDDYGNYSPIVSSSYWIGQDDFIASGVSVTSINTDFNNLFGFEEGIYCTGKVFEDWKNSEDYNPETKVWDQPANYTQKGFEWERMANISYLNEKHNLKCEQSIGIRIKGGTTRTFPKKSFNLYSRFLYDGNTKFDYKFNGKKCEKVSLRAGGNDTNLLITDPINSMMANKYNLNFDTQDTSPTYVYLNGEFWGIYFITDAYDSKFIEEKYDIEDSILWKATEIEEGYQTDIKYIYEAQSTISPELLSESGYAEFEKKFSISSLTDAIIFQSYIDNTDFYLFGSNSAFWRSRDIDDGINLSDTRLRYMLYDTDYSLGRQTEYTSYPKLFERIKASSTTSYLFDSDLFVAQLKERAAEIVSMLSSSECIGMVESYYNDVKELISLDNARYGHSAKSTLNRWDQIISFLNNRGDYYLSFINEL